MRQKTDIVYTPTVTNNLTIDVNFEDIKKSIDFIILKLNDIENRIKTLEAE